MINLEKNSIKEVISTNENLINNLYNLSIKLDTSNINQSQFKIEMNNIKNSYQSEIKRFNDVFKTNNKINTAKENLIKINNNLQPDLNSWQIKYNLIDIIINHSHFLEFFC